MKFFACFVLLAILGAASAGYIGSGWASPAYGYASPSLYSYGWGSPAYVGGYSGVGLYGSGWGSNYNGWNSGWW